MHVPVDGLTNLEHVHAGSNPRSGQFCKIVLVTGIEHAPRVGMAWVRVHGDRLTVPEGASEISWTF